MAPGDAGAVAPVLTALNICLAALVMALFLAFRTNAVAEESLGNAAAAPRRWRWGVWLVTAGLFVIVPAQTPGLLESAVRNALYFTGYPLMFAGIFLEASATWRTPWPQLAGRRGE